MNGRSAHCLAVPHRHTREIARDTPIAALGAGIQPCELSESFPGDLREAFQGLAFTGLEENDLDAATSQFARQRPATGARADDDHNVVVFEIKSWHVENLEPLPLKSAWGHCLEAGHPATSADR